MISDHRSQSMPLPPRLPTTALVIAAAAWTINLGTVNLAHSQGACIAITNVNQLSAMRNNLTGNFCLANDIDASTKPNFAPIGNFITPFTGKLDGRGHVIRNLRIRTSQQQVGLFGVARAAVI